MNRTLIGVIVGLVMGLALAFGTFAQMLIVALFALIGFIVAKILDGDIDLGRYISGRNIDR